MDVHLFSLMCDHLIVDMNEISSGFTARAAGAGTAWPALCGPAEGNSVKCERQRETERD